MRVMYHNWSATKQRLHPQSVAEKSSQQFCQGTGFNNVRHCLGLATRTQISVCKSPFPSAGTAVSLFHEKTVQQRPLLPRVVETRLPDCGVAHYVRIDQMSRLPVMPPSTFHVNWLQVQPQRLPDDSRSNDLTSHLVWAKIGLGPTKWGFFDPTFFVPFSNLAMGKPVRILPRCLLQENQN